eukprot:TRINITY_DN1650_c1_g1_i1.p1 TRINITY_DN1650_c1_g1~~TRINITY_DN1650_c1_g1_i1.p1  ORF type:complete len:288 (-),score=52.39 TRINITY_DN1650_c1_g1_i1:236-1027(-)
MARALAAFAAFSGVSAENVTLTGPGSWSCPAPLVSTDCVKSSWISWKSDKDKFQAKCKGNLVRWGEDSGVQDCGIACFACSFIRACCDTCLTIKSTTGFWSSAGCVDTDTQQKVEIGVKISESESFEVTEKWSTSVTASASGEASVEGEDGESGSGKIGLDASASHEFATKYSSSWGRTQSESYTRSWTQPKGTCAWTWNVKIEDSCNTRIATTETYELTPHGNPPCCMPGMSKGDDKYGACLPDEGGKVINLCGKQGETVVV